VPSCATAEVPAARITTNANSTTCGEIDRDFTLDFLSAIPFQDINQLPQQRLRQERKLVPTVLSLPHSLQQSA
jgi:hypothetical protein